jgi:predicted amidophosphoribosyltransferase
MMAEQPKLQSCPTCGGQISQQAKACPHCGHPLKDDPINAVAKGLIFFFFFLVLFGIALGVSVIIIRYV